MLSSMSWFGGLRQGVLVLSLSLVSGPGIARAQTPAEPAVVAPSPPTATAAQAAPAPAAPAAPTAPAPATPAPAVPAAPANGAPSPATVAPSGAEPPAPAPAPAGTPGDALPSLPPSPLLEQTPAPASQAETTAQDTDPRALTDFRPALDPYGTWVHDARYGLVWIPRRDVVGDGFAPYVTSGRWALDVNGEWIWVSDYPFGKVVFHYGRWVWTTAGWAWIPGYRWAPAWVVWRVPTGPYAYLGWAPMPPTWGWFGGVAVSFSYGLPWHWVFCPSAYVFHHHVHYYVVRDHAFVRRLHASTARYVPARPRVSTRRVLAGPPPRVARIPASAVPRERLPEVRRAPAAIAPQARPSRQDVAPRLPDRRAVPDRRIPSERRVAPERRKFPERRIEVPREVAPPAKRFRPTPRDDSFLQRDRVAPIRRPSAAPLRSSPAVRPRRP